MKGELAELRKQNAEQAAQIDRLLAENLLLSRKVQFLLKRMFGRKSEKLERHQLEFLLGGLGDTSPDNEDPPPW